MPVVLQGVRARGEAEEGRLPLLRRVDVRQQHPAPQAGGHQADDREGQVGVNLVCRACRNGRGRLKKGV